MRTYIERADTYANEAIVELQPQEARDDLLVSEPTRGHDVSDDGLNILVLTLALVESVLQASMARHGEVQREQCDDHSRSAGHHLRLFTPPTRMM